MSSYLRSAFVWAIAIIICFSFLTSTPMADVKFDQQDKQKGNAQQKKIKTGKVLGLVVNSTTGDALPRATVEVVSTGQTVYTDADGNFTLDLEPGTYELKATFEGFIEIRKEVTVSSTDVTPVDIALSQQGVGEVIEVVASSNSAVALLEERRSGTTIADSISREEISKDTGSDAASVLQRAPGLSVVGGKFVYVRGLGDRYSNTVLNDAALPTPLADRRTVPLDQVPSELVQNIKVLKSFTPDQPGEFAGGLVKIETLEIPNKTTFKISSSISANSVTTFRDFLRYPGDRLDFLGFGLGRRDLPSSIPMQQLRRGSALIPGFSADQLQQFGRAFENIWEPRSQRGTVNQNYGISGSKQIGKFGLVGNLTYSNNVQRYDELRNFFRVAQDPQGNPTLFAATRYQNNLGINNIRLGGLLTASYKLNSNNKFLFKFFASNDAFDEARSAPGFFDDRGNDIFNTRLKYVQSRTNTNQIAGESILTGFGNAILNYRLTYSRATAKEPDLRETLYEFDQTLGKLVYFETTQSGLRFFSRLFEGIREPAVDFSRFYFGQSYTFNFKVGFSFINRDREFTARRFRFFPRSFDGIDRTSRPELFYSSQNIRPDGLELFEDTRPTDFYVALQNLTAGYVMGDFTLRKFRFIGGVRFENSEQEVRTENLFVPGASPVVANLDNTDALPSFGLVYNLTPDINIRTGYSQTVSRPQFRELSPFEFSDFTGGRATLGNPNLKRALIRNFDVRFEKFQKDGGLLAASFFYKKFDNPIEIVVEATTSLRTSFRNAQGATNKGFELEGRQSLGRLSQKLQNLSINGNYSFVSSNIQIGDQDLSVLTSRERPLNGQSRHLVNMTLNYDIPQYKADARVLFNYTGARITDVGTFGLPDIFEKGYPTLDLFFSKRFGGDTNKFELKVTGENMLNRLVRFKQNDLPFLVYRKGRNISFGISYSFF